jgi:DNA replication and repair protein RecF
MILSELSLQNFRNYKKRKFGFDEGTTLIVGGNASGKTNILEACYLLATGRSFRAQKVEEMIHWDAEVGYVSGAVLDRMLGTAKTLSFSPPAGGSGRESAKEQGTELQVLLTRGELNGKRVAKRRYSVDGAFKRVSDFVGKLVVVLFRPEDLRLILGSPVRRRDFLDAVLVQVDREYRRSLVSYEKALSRRNKLLDAIRDEGASRTQLAFWDQLLIRHGQVLTKQRAELIDFVNGFEIDIDSFQVFYDNSTISEARLKKYMEQDIALGYTLVGPHKDDFIISSSEGSKSRISSKDRNSHLQGYGRKAVREVRELASYGSRGEQRLAVLWLKLAELEFVAEKIKDLPAGEAGRPVLLLDDIFSELDQEHRQMVLKVISHQQTIITTTDLHLVGDISDMKVIKLK